MTPVTNKTPMPQAPGKGIKSFPTPVIDDVVITEIVNAWKGDYKALDYGVKWDEAPHASMQGSHPDHKLVFQDPASADGEWIKRIWVNDRVNQDSYNYAIKYSGGSQSHPIYIRTYVLPREGYVPLPDLTPDDVYPTALLVEEEVQRNEGEMDSKYIKVVRVFETLQGPEISSLRYNERGDLEEVINQQVSPDTLPDSDGLLVTQSQVIKQDVSKGTKTTATVPSHSTLTSKEKKEGLLGETIVTDDIVDPSTSPDILSTTVISSSVEQTSKTKARKRTVTSTGPTSLSKLNKDGKLLGDTKVVRSVVIPTTLPDAPSSSILSSEIDQTDSGKAIKTNVVLNSTPILNGSKKSQGLLGVTTTQESIVPSGTLADDLTLNITSSQVEPIDSVRSRKVTETSSGPLVFGGQNNKQGLLGITNITETIVTSGTAADKLDFYTISSEVTPIDSAKSKKTTINAYSPKELTSNTLSSTPLGLVASKKEETIVTPSTTVTGSNTIISNDISTIDSSKNKQEKITVNKWPKLKGIDYDETLNIGLFYDKEIIDPQTYINSTSNQNFDGNPLDEWKTLKKQYDLSKIQSALESQYYKIQTAININLPDKLLDVVAYFGLSNGKGVDSSNAAGAGNSYNYSYSSSARSSSSVSGDLYFKVEKGFSGSIPATEHIFFIKTNSGGANSITNNNILTILNNYDQFQSRNAPSQVFNPTTYNFSQPPTLTIFQNKYQMYPTIKMISENVVLIGGSVSKSIGKSESASQSLNGSSNANSQNTSYDVNVNVNSVTVPETLHKEIKIKIEPIGKLGDIEVPYSVNPDTLKATNPSRFPVGNYLISSNISLYKFGYCKVSAITAEITSSQV